ncbi:MAG: 2-thiouracil desulfurase family protein [Thermoleophilia bacterium]
MPLAVRLGVSACLLGRKVRYDGGHKLDRSLIEALGPFVEWVPVCPEAETRLGVPREAMWLVGTGDQPRLITRRTRIDYTARMQT